ncbi:hypothetical protein AND_003321 [Anopheles darlingi]|uniref:Uncharacterized protein n=1 Tax=Anopheles darlingi TaxID=43151 RepID=W5JQB0_ANODA|nr:hypothetical protein AND_003321 [Anopheles darlingi]
MTPTPQNSSKQVDGDKPMEKKAIKNPTISGKTKDTHKRSSATTPQAIQQGTAVNTGEPMGTTERNEPPTLAEAAAAVVAATGYGRRHREIDAPTRKMIRQLTRQCRRMSVDGRGSAVGQKDEQKSSK